MITQTHVERKFRIENSVSFFFLSYLILMSITMNHMHEMSHTDDDIALKLHQNRLIIAFPIVGYPTLHAYLISIPHVARLTGNSAQGITVHGVANDTCLHVANMVGKQRPKQKKRGLCE